MKIIALLAIALMPSCAGCAAQSTPAARFSVVSPTATHANDVSSLITALAANTDQIILAPGYYEVPTNLWVPLKGKIIGYGATIKFTGSVAFYAYGDPRALSFEGVTLLGNHTQFCPIPRPGPTVFTFTNCRIDGLTFDLHPGSSFTNCQFTHASIYARDKCVIDGCTFTGPANSGGGVICVNGSSWTVSNCTFDGCETPLVIYGDNNIVSNCLFRNISITPNSCECMLIEGGSLTHTTLSRLTFSNCTGPLFHAASNYELSNLAISDWMVQGYCGVGIRVEAATDVPLSGAGSFHNNTISEVYFESTRQAIYIGGTTAHTNTIQQVMVESVQLGPWNRDPIGRAPNVPYTGGLVIPELQIPAAQRSPVFYLDPATTAKDNMLRNCNVQGSAGIPAWSSNWSQGVNQANK